MTAAIALTQRIVALGLLAAVVAFVAVFPVGRLWLAAGFSAYTLLLMKAPRAWLVLVPAAMPVLDLAFFSGWFFFDEFDALVLLTVAVLMWRQPLRRPDFRIGRPLAIAVFLLILSYAASAALVLTPWPAIDGNAFASYYSPFNALRVAKGFLWPLLLLPFLSRAARASPASGRLLAAGLLLGLFGICLVSLYEHWLFVGLFNFGHEYRISGPFSSMHTGSGHIGLWLAATIPLIAALFAERWPIPPRLAALCLGGLALYVLVATASRGPFLATATALSVMLMAFIAVQARRGKTGRVMLVASLPALCGLFAVPFLVHTALGDRFMSVARDFDFRLTHHGETLSLRDTDAAAYLFGMGLGTFPRIYDERRTGVRKMGRHSFDVSSGNRHLTLRSGHNIYFGQYVDVKPRTLYLFSFEYRTHDRDAKLTVAICEKWLLYSRRCSSEVFQLPPTDGRWVPFLAVVRTDDVGMPPGRIGSLSVRPIQMSLYPSRARSGIEIDDVALVTTDGQNLIRNGDFSANHDYWFWAEDYHLAWHTENMAVNIVFDQGWVGLVAVVMLTALALIALCRGVWAGKSDAVPWLAALVGYLIAALVVSPFDQPRLAMLFYLLCFVAILRFPRSGTS